ncbi:hypothetical protein ELE36_19795 [Pseudolysobacter antarcticus]|uniref:Sulfotransferase domain-containing protein n=1 Tax=Pseudolysobacter antarcticus TaxID=2511995 RepID=A0A411HPJ7_9GAMM|nr:hypothetical protein [Pseudolysobacter antarcticus]QBB72429.1 hypothetical protein ELE36_19795 [Pseudolysobacter antarcticus]
MKIVIAGQAKSGTTALYYAVKNALARDYICLFEPCEFTQQNETDVLVKILINPSLRAADFDDFEKKILLVRDPRDNLVSRMLYCIFDQSFATDQDKVAEFLQCLERKRQSPSTVALLELLTLLGQLSGEDLLERFLKRHHLGLQFAAQRPAYFVYRYEDFLAGKTTAIEAHLGVVFSAGRQVDPIHARVLRTGAAADWRNWFTPTDVDFFKPHFQQYLAEYGYETDWNLAADPLISAAHSTDYVRRLVSERVATPR